MAQTILNACCLGDHRFYFSSTSRKSRRSHGSSLSASKEPGPQGPRPAKQVPKSKRLQGSSDHPHRQSQSPHQECTDPRNHTLSNHHSDRPFSTELPSNGSNGRYTRRVQ